jgi:hypothetical protein
MTFSLDTTIQQALGYMYEYRKKMFPMQELETRVILVEKKSASVSILGKNDNFFSILVTLEC